VSSTAVVATFSLMRSILVVPGMGTMKGLCAEEPSERDQRRGCLLLGRNRRE
jgi:hypothetical protein